MAVYWITGLSRAGKTTISKILHKKLVKIGCKSVLLDGDQLRAMFGDDLGYSRNDRLISAQRNLQICKGLADQEFQVLCATISMFDDIRRWGRENIPEFRVIYLRVPANTLRRRGDDGFYDDGVSVNIVGADQDWDEPRDADLVLDNYGEQSAEDNAEIIFQRMMADEVAGHPS